MSSRAEALWPRRARRRQAFAFGRRQAAQAAIALGALAIGAVVAQSTLAEAMRETHPTRASALAPGNARVAIDGALALLAGGAETGDAAVRSRVRQALDRDATIPAALELEALDRQGRGDLAGAAHLYRMSDRISRRSLATRLWLVQDAVERGDAGRALGQMELALRTSSAAPDLIFPALANGLDDPALVQSIARLVDRPSEWRTPFLTYAMKNAGAAAAASLLVDLRDRRGINAAAFDILLVRLVDDGRFNHARQLARRFGRGTASALVADERFADEHAHYPFGWALTEGEAMGARRDVERGTSVLSYHANSAEGGQVAAQVLLLRPGSYRLATRVVRADSGELQPLWVLACAGSSKPLATVQLPSRDGGATARVVSIPANCPAQWLVLIVRPALNTQSGSVAGIELRRADPA